MTWTRWSCCCSGWSEGDRRRRDRRPAPLASPGRGRRWLPHAGASPAAAGLAAPGGSPAPRLVWACLKSDYLRRLARRGRGGRTRGRCGGWGRRRRPAACARPFQGEAAGAGHHGPVVGAQGRGGDEHPGREARPRRPGGPAGASWRPRPRRAGPCPGPRAWPRRHLADLHVHHRLLERGGDVGHVDVGTGLPHMAEHGRLQAGEGEVVGAVLQQGPWEPDRGRVAVAGQAVDHRPARVAEAEHPGHLVVGLAGGVVDRLAEPRKVPLLVHGEQAGVPAGDHEHDRRQRQGAVVEHVGVDVGDQVVDPQQGAVEGQRVGLGRRHPDQQRAGQAGADGDRDRVHVRQPGSAEGAGLLDRRVEQVDMGPRGDLGHHPAVAGVQGLLVGEHVGADRRPSSTRATPVSSQEVSIPSTSIATAPGARGCARPGRPGARRRPGSGGPRPT